MSETTKALFVRLATPDADRLSKAASSSGKSKRQLVAEAVRQQLDDDGGLVVGRVALRDAEPEVMTLAEAAALLRVEDRTLEKAAVGGQVPGLLLGGEWRFSREALLAWLTKSDPS
ncbi:MAG TPA: helix-turn-helix domain-containing protein [Solirubrobacteraceae bacterium]|nr:helix-turn-helix domain-containing protein [Solirubrobacteraceae bacterium]